MKLLIVILFALFVILYLLRKRQINEGFNDNKLIQSFKIKVGVFYDKGYESYYNKTKRSWF